MADGAKGGFNQIWNKLVSTAIESMEPVGKAIIFTADPTIIVPKLNELRVRTDQSLYGGNEEECLVYWQSFGWAKETIIKISSKFENNHTGTTSRPKHIYQILANHQSEIWKQIWAEGSAIRYALGHKTTHKTYKKTEEFHLGFTIPAGTLKAKLKGRLRAALGTPGAQTVEAEIRETMKNICAVWIWTFISLTVAAKINSRLFEFLWSKQGDGKTNADLFVFDDTLTRFTLSRPWDTASLVAQAPLDAARLISPWPYLGQPVGAFHWDRIGHIILHIREDIPLCHDFAMALKPRNDQEEANWRSVDTQGPTIDEVLQPPPISSPDPKSPRKFGHDVCSTVFPPLFADFKCLEDPLQTLSLSLQPDSVADAVSIRHSLSQKFETVDDVQTRFRQEKNNDDWKPPNDYTHHYGPVFGQIRSWAEQVKYLTDDVAALKREGAATKQEVVELKQQVTDEAIQTRRFRDQVTAMQVSSGHGQTETQVAYVRGDILIKTFQSCNDHRPNLNLQDYHSKIEKLSFNISKLRHDFAHSNPPARPGSVFPLDARSVQVLKENVYNGDDASSKILEAAFEAAYLLPSLHCRYTEAGLNSSEILPSSIQFKMNSHLAEIINRTTRAAFTIRCDILMPSTTSWKNQAWVRLLGHRADTWWNHPHKQNLAHLALIPPLEGLYDVSTQNGSLCNIFTENSDSLASFTSSQAVYNFYRMVKNAIRNFTNQIPQAVLSREKVVQQIRKTKGVYDITEQDIHEHFSKLGEARTTSIVLPSDEDLAILGSFLRFFQTLWDELTRISSTESDLYTYRASTMKDKDGQVIATTDEKYFGWSSAWWAEAKEHAGRRKRSQKDWVSQWPILADTDDGALPPDSYDAPED